MTKISFSKNLLVSVISYNFKMFRMTVFENILIHISVIHNVELFLTSFC